MQGARQTPRGSAAPTRRSGPQRWVVVVSSALAVTLAGHTLLHAQAAPPSPGRSAWDGLYTDVQAERGTMVFGQSCARCHTLAPGTAKSLSGAPFWESYTQRTVGDLLTYLSRNMPNGSGGSLPAQSYNDLVAAILKSNGFPSGGAELTPETAAGVQILPKNGSTELPANALVHLVGCLARQEGGWVLTSATPPARSEKIGVDPGDAARPLGTGTVALKFVVTRLDPYVGRRMSVSGMLIGAGGADGINVTTISPVADTCP
jgi:mono/diheme cytochrome c family protein